MSKEKPKDRSYSDRENGSNKGNYGRIGENKSDQDKLRKGAEITPRPEKPKENNSGNDKKSQ